MRRLFFGTLAACQLAAGALAAATCVSPQEMKALQAAALEQQLAAAAQSCRFTADYSQFVTKYQGAIVRSDRAVKAFFRSRTNSEGYDVYKTRIAQDASLRSLHDPQFCRGAKTVFDMALGRGGAGKSPAMVQTGYEHCKMPVPPRNVVVTTTTPAARGLALASTPAIPSPAPRVAFVPATKPAPVHTARVLASHASSRAVETAPRVRTQTEHPETAQPRAAAIERPQWRQVNARPHAAPHEAYRDGGNTPNAYKAGSVWVGAEADLPQEQGDQRPLVKGPDGRWYVPIGHQETWQRD